MNDTIFVPSFGNRPQVLVGRDDVINQFNQSLKSVPGSRDRVLLLLGQRGTGKTVLLLELADMAKKEGIIVASPTIVSSDLTDRILEKLQISTDKLLNKKNKSKVSGGNLSIMGFGAGIQLQDNDTPKSFARSMSELCQKANEQGHAILILVDEVQAHNEELKKLIVAYQELVGEGMDIYLILAGLPETISSVLNDHVLTFLNRAHKIDLPPLKSIDIQSYYKSTFKKLGISISPSSIINATAETEGSPYLMQLIGHYLTVMEDNNSLDDATVNQAISSAKTDYKNDICKTALASLSDKDIDFLAAMSEDDGESSISSITKRLGCTAAYTQTYKRRLVQAGVIRQPRRGTLIENIPYLKEYMREMV